MAKSKGFQTNAQAIVDLSKQTQESLKSLPPDARILGFATGMVGLYGILQLSIIFHPPDTSLRTQVLSGANGVLIFSGIIIVLYILGRMLFHWMSLWEKIQLQRLQNEKARSEEASEDES